MPSIFLRTTNIDFGRPTSSHGIGTSYMPTSNSCARSVDLRVICHITIGHGGTKIPQTHHCLMAVPRVSEVAEPTFQGETIPAFLTINHWDVRSNFHPGVVEAVLPAHSQSKSQRNTLPFQQLIAE
jgi:hypothetical protein